MSTYVRYQVPVLVEVDADRVIAVEVDDEAVTGPFEVFDADGVQGADVDTLRAVRVAEESSWPAWTFP